MIKEEYQWTENFPKFFEKIYNKSSEVLFEEYNKNILETIRNEGLKEYTYHFNRIDPLSFFTKIVLCSKKLWPLMKDYDKTIELKNNPQLGIPALYNSMIEWWTEAYDKGENEEEISKVFNNLEKFAFQIHEDKIEKDLFNTICKYERNGLIKVSMLLFLIRPDKYYSLDDKMQNYLGFSINYNNDSYDEFCRLQKFLHEKYKNYSQKIYEISYDAEKKFLKEKEEHPEKFLDTYQTIAIAMSLGDKETYQEEEIRNLDFCKHLKPRAHIFNALQKDYFEKNNQGEYFLTDKGKNYAENFILQHPNDDNETETTTNEIQYWLKSANPKKYDHKGAFDKNGFIDWRQHNTYNVNDIVYIYSSGNDKRVRYKTIVEKTNMTFDEIEDDREFWKDIDEYEKSKNGKFSRLRLLKEVGDIPDLRYQNLIDSNYINHQNNLLVGFQITDECFIELLNNCFGDKTMTKFPLNQILYGPPGTGKTYNTVVKAMEIIGSNYVNMKDEKGNFKTDYSSDEYKKLKEEFDNYKNEGRIEFVTFHQSYSYEEFVEGIKPEIDWENDNENNEPNNKIRYTGKKGIFRKICEKANDKLYKTSSENITFKDIMHRLEDEIKDSPYIHTVKGKKFEVKEIQQKEQKVKYLYGTTKTQKNFALDKMEALLKQDNNYDNADAFYKDYAHESYSVRHYPYAFYNNLLRIKKDLLKEKEITSDNKQEININADKYILIIDEINRGNISKIFGELITLIEEDKRLGKVNAITITLPNSQEKDFGVPANLYIIGTMNTSDRSIASIDIALRRRFIFKEIMPNVNLVPDIEVFGIELRKIFTTLNERISILLDRDHQIGHSYFMKLENSSDFDSGFKRVWYDCIMPLLNEYFYGDWEKLCALLGDFQPEGKSFIKKINNVKFANSYSCDEDETYDFVSEANIDFEAAIKNAFKNL